MEVCSAENMHIHSDLNTHYIPPHTRIECDCGCASKDTCFDYVCHSLTPNAATIFVRGLSAVFLIGVLFDLVAAVVSLNKMLGTMKTEIIITHTLWMLFLQLWLLRNHNPWSGIHRNGRRWRIKPRIEYRFILGELFVMYTSF